ncbi:MAG: RHS repeat-associated core domain-containing protein [Phycisphaerales bacterium]|nr:RHS repeat-associated core domain-containing protein [Phycisphaerales bacterium]
MPALDGDDYGGLTVSGWGTSASGGSLTSTYTYDGLGRLTSSTSPGGVKSYSVRERREAFGHADGSGATGHIYFYSEVRLPHQLSASGPFDGPASVVISNAGGKTIQSSEYALDAEDYDPTALSYTLGTELSLRTVQLDSSGLVTSTRAYSDIAGDAHSDTAYTYDQLGRLLTTTDPSGTISKNSSFDIFGRVLAVQVGTGSGNMQTIAEYFYDSAYGGSPAQGVGDGLLTHVIQHTGETGTGALSSSESRTTVRRYDWRNRLMITENPAAPHEVMEYDNLGRVTKRGLYSSVPDPEDLIDSSGRGLYSRTSYSQRGMVYRQETAIDAANLSSGYLATNRWFDADGRTIAEWGPNGPASKTSYDGLGRPTVAYVTDRAGDAAPGASGNHADAAALTGDHVAEQAEYRYDSKGRTDLITTRRRPHDSSVTGAMGASDGINTFVAYYYDAADRRTHTVSFGTNTSNDRFEAGGSAPTWPPEEAPDRGNSAYDNTIITSVAFNERGLVDESVDGEGIITKYFYDDLSRRIAVVENYVNATISWNGTAGRWEAGGLSSSEPDTDRVTSFVHDAAGNVIKQVAHLIEGTTEKAQVTAYDYGTSVGAVSTSSDSLVASNSLLLRVRYPQESGDHAGEEGGVGTTSLQVRYSYNRLGELRSVIDQNTTSHVYRRDTLGRVESDTADDVPEGIDVAVLRIGVAYDSFGRTDAVTSYSDESGSTTANAVKFTYSPLWQIAKVYQDPNSAVGIDGSGNPTGDTKVVEYAYSTSAAPSSGTSHANYSRLASLTYPDGRVVSYNYGSANGLDDRAGRVFKMTTTGLTGSTSIDTLVEYSRIGLDMFAEVDFPMPDVQLDRTLSHDGKRYTGSYTSQTAGVYPGFDRFGRVARQAWADGTLTTHSTDSTISSRPPIVEETHTYDRASNRKSKTDARKGAAWSNRDFGYTYDGLHRLIEAKRGDSTTSFATPRPGTQTWSLDMLGNWNSIGTDTNGDGDTSDISELDTRTHNMANELLSRSLAYTVPIYDHAYDAAGNTTEVITGPHAKRRYTHDAWNRLVKAESGVVSGGSTTWTTTGQYQYNGLHWRVVGDSDRATPTGLDRRTYMYYSAGWQLLQEDVDDFTNGQSPDGVNSRSQEVWGLRYIDDAMVRLHDKNLDGDSRDAGELFWQLSDAQFSSVAVIDQNAVLQERVSYTSYGVGTHRWPHEVNNTGGVTTSGTTSDYGVIDGLAAAHSGAGTTIDETTYNVAADLNRDGVIDSGDTSLFTSMGGAKSALASGLISDPSGPNNPFGYDGYVYNPDQALYTVRFRWYNPSFGRWLQRDPAGYVDGSNLFEATRSNPGAFVDPTGLFAEAGHYYTTFIAAVCAGKSITEAQTLAYYSQYPDEVADLDAASLYKDFAYRRKRNTVEDNWMMDVQMYLHSLRGSTTSPECLRECLHKLVSDSTLPRWLRGLIIHAFGDSFAHVSLNNRGQIISYPPGLGHAEHTAGGFCPDQIGNNPKRHRSYFNSLCQSLGGSTLRCSACAASLPATAGLSVDDEIAAFRNAAIGLGLNPSYKPEGGRNIDAARPVLRGRGFALQAIDLIKQKCGSPGVGRGGGGCSQ